RLQLAQELAAALGDRRPHERPERLPAVRPRQAQLVARLRGLRALELEDVLGVLEEAGAGEDGPDLADLVEEPPLEPVLAEELVLLDVREHRPRQPEQLVERTPRLLVAEQRAVLVGEPVALGL